MPKSYRVGGGVGGGPCDFSVSPSPFGLDFGTLDFVTSDSGLTIAHSTVLYVLTFCLTKKLSICAGAAFDVWCLVSWFFEATFI